MLERFRTWWDAPPTRRDRSIGCMVGLFAGFWIGALGHIVMTTAASGTSVLAWGVAGAFATAITGFVFPKAVTLFLFPFAVFGTGG
jgi:hypothetical protein